MPTPITFTDLDIINQALTGAMGEGRISNLEDPDDQSIKAQVMRENYEAVSEAAQTATSWRFNTTKLALSKLTDDPPNRWSAAWQLPPDNLKVLHTWPPGNYEIQGNKLYSNNTDSIEIDYQRKLAEALWTAWFMRYVVAELVLRTVRGITGDDPTQAMKDELKNARDDGFFQDAQQQPNQAPLPNPFVDCRL
jgi:hypothetical protein